LKKESSPPSSSSSRSTKKLRYRPAPCHRGRPTHRAKQRRSGSPTALESDVLTKQQPPRSRRREAPGSKPPRQEANTYTPQATTMVAWRSRRGTHRDKNCPRIQARKRQTSSALHNPLASTAGGRRSTQAIRHHTSLPRHHGRPREGRSSNFLTRCQVLGLY